MTDLKVNLDWIVFTGLGSSWSDLTIADHATGRDSVLAAGPARDLTIQIAGIQAADFDLFLVLL